MSLTFFEAYHCRDNKTIDTQTTLAE